MENTYNYLAITDNSSCIRWLQKLDGRYANLIFVEPNDTERIASLLQSVEVAAVLLQLNSKVLNSELLSDEETSPSITAVMTYLQEQEESSVAIADDTQFPGLSSDLVMIESLLNLKSNLTVIGLVNEIKHSFLLPIMRAGARDLIKIGSPANEASAILSKYIKRSGLGPIEKPVLGKLTALVNARSEDGTAILAIHLALILQESAPTLLIDLGAPHADIMLMMDVTNKFNFLNAVNNSTRLDSTMIQTGFAKHSSGLTLLPMSEEDEGAELTPADIHVVLHILKTNFKHIVINHGGLCNLALLDVVLSSADATLFVVEQTLPSCKRNYDLMQSIRDNNTKLRNPGLIVDSYANNTIPNADSIAKSLDIPVLAKLPVATKMRLMSINTGESMLDFAPKCEYVKSVRNIAKDLYGIDKEKSNNNIFSYVLTKLKAALL